jgi:outer membrane protein assembly factor BamA
MVRATAVVGVLVSTLCTWPARADPPLADAAPTPLEEEPSAAQATRAAQDDPSFGPSVEIERIQIEGNSRTAERLIRRALLVKEGDVLRTGDRRFKVSRFRVLALGYFYDVKLKLVKGSARGKVVVVVEVMERGTFILNRLYFGASEASPDWFGVDVADGNFFGTGLTVGGALVWTGAGGKPGERDQWAGRLRYGDPSVFGLPLAVSGELLYSRASEPYDRGVGVDPGVIDYTRAGGSLGAGYDVTRQLRALVQLRVERVVADDPVSAPPDGYLEPGTSWVSTVAVGVDRDTRADPVLPQGGDRAVLSVEGGAGDYDFLKLRGRYERWFPLRGGRHVLSIHAGAGAIFGEPPGFDRFHVGEVDKLLPPRPLELVVSTRRGPDFLGLSKNAPLFGDVAVAAELEYSYRLFRRTGHIYGGDLFVGAGVFGLWDRGGVAYGVPSDRAIDLTFDVGLRLDTEVGVFELSLANAIGRVPL